MLFTNHTPTGRLNEMRKEIKTYYYGPPKAHLYTMETCHYSTLLNPSKDVNESRRGIVRYLVCNPIILMIIRGLKHEHCTHFNELTFIPNIDTCTDICCYKIQDQFTKSLNRNFSYYIFEAIISKLSCVSTQNVSNLKTHKIFHPKEKHKQKKKQHRRSIYKIFKVTDKFMTFSHNFQHLIDKEVSDIFEALS
ncbi:CLUMA_CG002706, isoform A [Clunio marinus]|uniref:CLUMA_CG002706, isoform A n=1 Tax=Clunio marinus TaxID=568069 RepID=A0A1J1HLH0_9DIPT|nr:CLUMA_CG002706, isoform A [Clunio marinus]